MRWHPRRLLLCILILTVAILSAVWYYKSSRGKIVKVTKKAGKWSQFGASDGQVFWSDTSGVKKGRQDRPRKGTNREIRDDGNGGFVFDVNYGDDESYSMHIKFNMNIDLSDQIPLNRKVPDSRPAGCKKLTYPKDLPTTSVVIPFHNEWPSVLLRTVHSLFNRTPSNILKQIILVDDASNLSSLKIRLDRYVNWTFPEGLVKVVRLKEREGLIRARLEGFKYVTSEVVSFFDSHMEVNKDWIQPLLTEIVKNPKTVAMAQLDYIGREDFEYTFFKNYRTRYGFKWDMEFFETFFRPDQLKGKLATDPLPGVLMVGPGFAVRSQYFRDLGMYDSGMKIWGGENIEFAWRTWMCGGQLLHIPCSRVGHIERSQPYSFPQGRQRTELHNYKRAAEVWMGPYKKYVFDALPGIARVKIGNMDERIKLKHTLECKDFSWFLKNIWPELLPYEDVGTLWGEVKTLHGDSCLDNDGYLFKDPMPLKTQICSHRMIQQGFALTSEGLLRTTLHCVVAYPKGMDLVPLIQNCMLDVPHKWVHDKLGRLVHLDSDTCLQAMSGHNLVLQPCEENLDSQRWIFIKTETEQI